MNSLPIFWHDLVVSPFETVVGPVFLTFATSITMTSLHPGDQLDHYRIDGLVARSGMASIFRGTDMRDGRQVAIKIPHPEMEGDPVLYDRFQRELQIGQKLDHPHVMKVFSDGDRSQLYMVMEWVGGRLLRQLLNEQKKLSLGRAVKIAVAIAE